MSSDSEDDLFVKKKKGTNNKKKKDAPKKRKQPKEDKVFNVEDVLELTITQNQERQIQGSDETIESIYCPACQAPLHYLKISPEIHAASCAVDWSKLPECSEGSNCTYDSIFHFRDFAHTLLAEFRSTKSFVSPRVKRRVSSKSKPRKSSGSLRKASQNVQTFAEVDDEAKEKVKRKLDLDDPGRSTSKQETQSESSFWTEDLSQIFDDDSETPSCSGMETKNLRFKSPILIEDSKLGKSNDIPGVRKRKNSSNMSPSVSGDSDEQEIKKRDSADFDPGYKKRNESHFDVSFKKRKLSSESQFLNNCKPEIKVASKPESGPSISNKENLDSETQFSNLSFDFKSEPSTKTESDSENSSVSYRKVCGTATDSQLADFSWGSNVNSQPCSSPSISEAPEYLLKGVCSVEIKDEPVEIKNEPVEVKDEPIEIKDEPVEVNSSNTEDDLFVNSQDFQSEMLTPKSELVKEECFSLGEKSTACGEQASNLNADVENQVCDKIKEEHPSTSGCSNSTEQCIKSEVCSNNPLLAFDETDIPDLSSDEEFERCFEKHNEFFKKQETEPYSDQSSNDSSVFKGALTSKKQENSKSLWKQILKPKVVPSNGSVSSSGKQKVFSKSRVITMGGESEEKNLVEPPKRTCPFYKKIPDTNFVVDAFSYGIIPNITTYFLSHFHADHYIGLRKGFNKPIYCSKITARLVRMKIGVKEEYLHILNLKEPIIISGVEVTALDANHCPGALMFLFRLIDDRQYLHVGDFRACREMESEPLLRKAHITGLFLDTTYCNPQYTFPLQKDIIQMVVQVVERKVSECPNLLVVCGSYTIGKEKVFLGVLEKFSKWKLWANTTKRRVLDVLENSLISSKLVDEPQEANIHVLTMGELNFQALFKHLGKMKGAFSQVLAFKPTGWEMSKGTKSGALNHITSGKVTIYGVPYSEHSSYSELCRFTQFIAPDKVIPTVSVGNPASRKRMMNIIDGWLKKPESQREQKTLKSFF